LGENPVTRKKAECKTGNDGSGASLGFEQKLLTADKTQSYTYPAEYMHMIFGLDLKGSDNEI
jgi:hypothetical protein